MLLASVRALVIGACFAGPAVAGTLYSVNTPGGVYAVDPATGLPVPAGGTLRSSKHVVTRVGGIGRHPTSGALYAFAEVADACTLDPSRTAYAEQLHGNGCNGLTEAVCEQAFQVDLGEPWSCVWTGGGGCERCNSAYQSCVNTCEPPPACPSSPPRTRFAGVGAERCAAYDGDAAACGEAYFYDLNGASTCFADGTLCRGCDVAAAVAGQCERGCAPPATCDDPARTLYVGSQEGCMSVGTDEDACATAFAAWAGLAMPCLPGDDGGCYGVCAPQGEAQGRCLNTCEPSPGCPGAPQRTLVATCWERSGDAPSCAGAYMRDYAGTFGCFLGATGECLPCVEQFEREGGCVDACNPPVCAGDPSRTTLAAGGADGCHAFDGDETACAQAFYVGSCGEASCAWTAATSECRPCTSGDPEGCTNACGSFTPLHPGPRPSLITVAPATWSIAVVGEIDADVGQPAPGDADEIYAFGARSRQCHPEDALLFVDSLTGAVTFVASDAQPVGGAVAYHPGERRLYRLVRGETDLVLVVTDPATGASTTTAVEQDVPDRDEPTAMTWADPCGGFVVVTLAGDVLVLDPVTGILTRTAVRVHSIWDEGDWPVGVVLEGDVCPVLTLPTTTSSTTSTSTTSSTSTSTLPNELLAGTRLVLTDDRRRPQRRALLVRSRDRSLALGSGKDGPDDPVLHGASLRVAAASGGFDVTYPLDDGWRHLGKRGRMSGYKWKSGGPIRSIVVREGAGLDIAGKGPALAHSLVADPGEVSVVLRLGARQWCFHFGGTFDTRTPRRLSARNAPPPSACPPPN